MSSLIGDVAWESRSWCSSVPNGWVVKKARVGSDWTQGRISTRLPSSLSCCLQGPNRFIHCSRSTLPGTMYNTRAEENFPAVLYQEVVITSLPPLRIAWCIVIKETVFSGAMSWYVPIDMECGAWKIKKSVPELTPLLLLCSRCRGGFFTQPFFLCVNRFNRRASCTAYHGLTRRTRTEDLEERFAMPPPSTETLVLESLFRSATNLHLHAKPCHVQNLCMKHITACFSKVSAVHTSQESTVNCPVHSHLPCLPPPSKRCPAQSLQSTTTNAVTRRR